MDKLMLYVITIAGILTVVSAYFEFDFFMNHRKAQFFIKILGRNGARIFYVILGSALTIIGGLFILGVIPMKYFD